MFYIYQIDIDKIPEFLLFWKHDMVTGFINMREFSLRKERKSVITYTSTNITMVKFIILERKTRLVSRTCRNFMSDFEVAFCELSSRSGDLCIRCPYNMFQNLLRLKYSINTNHSFNVLRTVNVLVWIRICPSCT